MGVRPRTFVLERLAVEQTVVIDQRPVRVQAIIHFRWLLVYGLWGSVVVRHHPLRSRSANRFRWSWPRFCNRRHFRFGLIRSIPSRNLTFRVCDDLKHVMVLLGLHPMLLPWLHVIQFQVFAAFSHAW